MKDVVKIIKILNVLSDKVETDGRYISSICSLLKIFQYPFFKEKSSDELVFESVIVECIANIGRTFFFVILIYGVRGNFKLINL
jgi:protein tyrosine phosphatase